MMTVAQSLMEEGRQEGRQEGMQTVKSILSLLKSGTPPEQVIANFESLVEAFSAEESKVTE